MSNKIPPNKSINLSGISESPINHISPLTPLNQAINLPKLVFPSNEFFTNAKPASMLEKGLKLSTIELNVGDEGLYMERDGPTIIVRVKAIRCIPIAELQQQNPKNII
jgi:topoisomerase IA-like protein